MHKRIYHLMLDLNLKKYCENNEQCSLRVGGKTFGKNGIVILDVVLNMLIPTAVPI